MRTLFDFELETNPRISVDRRAKQRGKRAPAFTDVRWIESFNVALSHANVIEPVAIIKENGSCLLFSSGGSGIVWVCSADGQPSEAQQEMVDVIVTHLMYLGAVIQGSDTLRYFDSDIIGA